MSISIHALLAESDPSSTRKLTNLMISIHALLAESDLLEQSASYNAYMISIHALLAESDNYNNNNYVVTRGFLSTLSLRRATESQPPCVRPTKDFYPRSPCGERRRVRQRDKLHNGNFYPRSPCGERHNARPGTRRPYAISIHALLAESDCITEGSICLDSRISIHALLAESDAVTTLGAGSVRDFYPRSPCGERPVQIIIVVMHALISIHALLAESDPEYFLA